MSVTPEGDGSRVKIITEFTLTGRVAQFGRGVIEDVSKRMVRDVAECIQANLEPAQTEAASPASDTAAPPPATATRASSTAQPVNAASLLFSVLWDRIRRLFGSQPR
jgi:hypothetical protein